MTAQPTIHYIFSSRILNRFFSKTRGKVAVINEAIKNSQSEIIVLSDASALISMDALKIIVRKMDCPSVGVVAGTYCFLKPGSEGEKSYWEYQVSIKKSESDMGSVIGVHGALYSFKKDLFKPLDADTINDDFILPMQIVKDGYRCIYDTDIVAVELENVDIQLDQQRRKRISAGNMQQTLRLIKLANPKYGATAFNFISGKFLRTWMPFILLTVFISSALLATHFWWVSPIVLLQSVIYGLAIVVHKNPNHKWNRPATLVHYLVAGHWANGIGGLKYLCGLNRNRWHKISTETSS